MAARKDRLGVEKASVHLLEVFGGVAGYSVATSGSSIDRGTGGFTGATKRVLVSNPRCLTGRRDLVVSLVT